MRSSARFASLAVPVALFALLAACSCGRGKKGHEAESIPANPPRPQPGTGTTSSGGILPETFALRCLPRDAADTGYYVDATFHERDKAADFVFQPIQFAGPGPKSEPYRASYDLERTGETYALQARHDAFTFRLPLPDNVTHRKQGEEFTGQLRFLAAPFDRSFDPWMMTCTFTSP